MKTLPVWLPPSFLVASALVLLMYGTGVQAILLLFALMLQMVYAATEKKSFFLIGFIGFALASFYLMWQGNSLWNVGWITTLFIALFLGYESTSQAVTESHTKEALQKELARGLDLWKNRFETSHEKIVSDKEVWSDEIEKLNQAIAEKQREADSLRVLIQVSHRETKKAEEQLAKKDNSESLRLLEELQKKHKETELLLDLQREDRNEAIRILEDFDDLQRKYKEMELDQTEFQRILDELNELRCTHHETELLLEKANQTLAQQQEALRQRQTINESLHTKPIAKPRISLKDLARKF